MMRFVYKLRYDPVVRDGDVSVNPIAQPPFPTLVDPDESYLSSCPGPEVVRCEFAIELVV